MAYASNPASSSGGGGGPLFATTALARAQALLGPTVTKYFGTDFGDTAGWTTTLTGSATAALSTTIPGGVLASATGGIGSAITRPSGAPGLTVNPTTTRFYVRSKFRLQTGNDANTYLAVSLGFTGSSNGLFVGATARSLANYTYDFYNSAGVSAGFGSLGVALDTNVDHVAEILGDTTNFYVYFDQVLKVTLAIPASFTAPANWRIDCTNVAAVNREIDVDEICLCTPP